MMQTSNAPFPKESNVPSHTREDALIIFRIIMAAINTISSDNE